MTTPRATAADQRSRVLASLTCTAAHDIGGPRSHHPSTEDRLAADLADTRAALCALADLIARRIIERNTSVGLDMRVHSDFLQFADLARRIAAGDRSLIPEGESKIP